MEWRRREWLSGEYQGLDAVAASVEAGSGYAEVELYLLSEHHEPTCFDFGFSDVDSEHLSTLRDQLARLDVLVKVLGELRAKMVEADQGFAVELSSKKTAESE